MFYCISGTFLLNCQFLSSQVPPRPLLKPPFNNRRVIRSQTRVRIYTFLLYRFPRPEECACFIWRLSFWVSLVLRCSSSETGQRTDHLLALYTNWNFSRLFSTHQRCVQPVTPITAPNLPEHPSDESRIYLPEPWLTSKKLPAFDWNKTGFWNVKILIHKCRYLCDIRFICWTWIDWFG